MLIWATQVRNLGWKSPKNNHSHEISNSSCFWQNLKFRGNGSCFKMSVGCWPAPGRRAAQARKTKPMWLRAFTPLKRLGLAQIKKEHLGFLFCGSSFKYHPPDSWNFEHEEETREWMDFQYASCSNIFWITSYLEREQNTEIHWGKIYSCNPCWGVEWPCNLLTSPPSMYQEYRWFQGVSDLVSLFR